MTAPWGPEDAVSWGLRTGRLHPRSEARWRASLVSDPEGTEQTLAILSPVLSPDTEDGRQLRHLLGVDGPPDELAGLYPPEHRDLDAEPNPAAHLFPPTSWR